MDLLRRSLKSEVFGKREMESNAEGLFHFEIVIFFLAPQIWGVAENGN